MKHFLDHIFLSEVYSFEVFSNQHKNDEMVNNYSYSYDFKNLLILPKIVSNIVFNFNHTYWLNYTKAVHVKNFLHNILLLKVDNFEGFLNRSKTDGMVNNH